MDLRTPPPALPLPPASRYPNAAPRQAYWFERPWAQQPTAVKAAVVGTGVVAAGAAVFGVYRFITKPRPFTSVADQCNDFAFGDREEINDALNPMVRSAANRGAVDPFAVTTAFVQKYAPQCRTWPEPVRNPGEAKLFLQSFLEVLRVMEEQQLLSADQKAYFLEMVSVWGKFQGIPLIELPVKPPATQASAPVVDQEEPSG